MGPAGRGRFKQLEIKTRNWCARKRSIAQNSPRKTCTRKRAHFAPTGKRLNAGGRFCKVTAKGVSMTRFDILAILAAQTRPISCKRLAELSGERRWYRRSFQADLATRLRRLYRWGLLHRWRARDGSLGNARAKYLWSLSPRGRSRLDWAAHTHPAVWN